MRYRQLQAWGTRNLGLELCGAFVVVLFAGGTAGSADAPAKQRNCLDAFMLLRSNDLQEQTIGRGVLRAGYDETVTQFIELIETKGKNEPKDEAESQVLNQGRAIVVEALGKLRAREAIPALVKNITFVPPYVVG